MKFIAIALMVATLLVSLIHADERRTIVLHAVKIVKIDDYVPFILEDDYGYVVLNDGTEEDPKPRYILGSQREGTVIHYTTKNEFLAAIAKIPSGATLRQYAKCLAPLSWGLKEDQLVDEDVPKIAKEKGINFTEKPKLHCNCESSVFKPRKVEKGDDDPQPARAGSKPE